MRRSAREFVGFRARGPCCPIHHFQQCSLASQRLCAIGGDAPAEQPRKRAASSAGAGARRTTIDSRTSEARSSTTRSLLRQDNAFVHARVACACSRAALAARRPSTLSAARFEQRTYAVNDGNARKRAGREQWAVAYSTSCIPGHQRNETKIGALPLSVDESPERERRGSRSYDMYKVSELITVSKVLLLLLI